LTPRLEKAVAAVQGVKLAKLNVDVEADIAGQLRVDMLPTLFLIYEVGPLLSPSDNSAPLQMMLNCLIQGKVVEKISGTLTPQGVEALMAKAVKAAGLKTQASHNETLIAAGKLLSQGEPDKAAALYAQAPIPQPPALQPPRSPATPPSSHPAPPA
jgi:thioredoxin-like negative regulator of GroEL